jgi:hypothetical protein
VLPHDQDGVYRQRGTSTPQGLCDAAVHREANLGRPLRRQVTDRAVGVGDIASLGGLLVDEHGDDLEGRLVPAAIAGVADDEPIPLVVAVRAEVEARGDDAQPQLRRAGRSSRLWGEMTHYVDQPTALVGVLHGSWRQRSEVGGSGRHGYPS